MKNEIIIVVFFMIWGAFITNLDRIQPWLEKKIRRLGEKMSGELK